MAVTTDQRQTSTNADVVRGVVDPVTGFSGIATADSSINLTATEVQRINGGYALLKDAALRPANQGNTMASPPTITVGVADAASVIASPVNIAWNDARLTYSTRVQVGGVSSPDTTLAICAYLDTAAAGAASTMRGLYTSFSFSTEETKFEVRAKGFSRHRLWVIEEDGVPRVLTEQVMASTGSVYRVLYDFGGSRKVRKIVVQFTASIGGLSIAATGSISKWAPIAPKLLLDGDSFVESTGATSVFTGFAPRLAEALGCYGTAINCGIGGTGFIADNGGTKKNALERVTTSVIANAPDVYICMHGLNDATDVSANAAAVFDAVHVALPKCLIIVCSPFQPRSVASVLTRTTELTAVCAARPWVRFINSTSASSNPEITGTGRVGATTGTGNSDWVIGADNTHPTNDGHSHISVFKDGIIRILLGIS